MKEQYEIKETKKKTAKNFFIVCYAFVCGML